MTLERDTWNYFSSPSGPFGPRSTYALSIEKSCSFLPESQFRSQQQFTEGLIRRLGLAYELRGHGGCVNCLSFNDDGTLLASGSDDCQIRVWDHRKNCRHVVNSGHTGNIFGVKFLPGSSDHLVISCAADGSVRLHDLNFGETSYVFTCHVSRAKRVATSPDSPSIFWSAGEDGLVIQYDLREPRRCDSQSCRNVLINLNPYISSPELKSIACNPVRTELLVVGATDCFTRLYDRRKLSLTTVKYPETMLEDNRGFIRRYTWLAKEHINMKPDHVIPPGCVRYFTPGHLPLREAESHNEWKSFSVTDVRFSADGAYILSNVGGEQIYLFEINSNDPISKTFAINETSPLREKNATVLKGMALALKETANTFYHQKSYINAVQTYDRAIQRCSRSSVLYANRSLALMKRNWDGDCYQAVLDAYKACLLCPDNDKAQFRLIRGLLQVGRVKDAQIWLEHFRNEQRKLVENQLTSKPFLTLEKDIISKSRTHKNGARKRRPAGDSANPLQSQEMLWRESAIDYARRFVGHCNTTTDIKEANFVGDRGQFIMAGSDDGSFFIWDRESTNLLKVIRGDSNIVNCLQAHPTTCLIATSGIDDQIRIWAPQPDCCDDPVTDTKSTPERAPADAAIGSAIEDVARATNANQRRMHADPWSLVMGSWRDEDLPNGPPGGQPLFFNPNAPQCVQQ